VIGASAMLLSTTSGIAEPSATTGVPQR